MTTAPRSKKQIAGTSPSPRRPAARGGRQQTAPAIEFRDVHLAFDAAPILRGVSFKVYPGEMKILLGGSGTGKSTLLNLILGLLKPDCGQILINGEDITPYSEKRMIGVRAKIGMVFQEGALFDSLSVYDNVAYRLHERRVAEGEVDREVRAMLGLVELDDAIDLMPNELSGGMQRRVGIARALVGHPRIVLFDEPTAGLDPPTSRRICRLAVRLRDTEKVSSIFVTHRVNLIKYIVEGDAAAATKDTGRRAVKRIAASAGKAIHAGDEGEEAAAGAAAPRLSHTTILVLHKGNVIFDGTHEELRGAADPYIRKFLRGR